MKKFISGIIVGLLLFAGTTAFADTAKSILGQKVQGTYQVTFNGSKISDAAVIDGSTYLPVRSLSEAAGINISVEGKKINLTTDSGLNNIPNVSDADIDKINAAKGAISAQINTLTDSINTYKRNIEIEKNEALPPYQKRLTELKVANDGSELAKQGIEIVQGKIDESNKYIADLQAKITVAEAEIKQLQAELAET